MAGKNTTSRSIHRAGFCQDQRLCCSVFASRDSSRSKLKETSQRARGSGSPEAQETPGFLPFLSGRVFGAGVGAPADAKQPRTADIHPAGVVSALGRAIRHPFHGLPVVMTASGRDRPAIAV